MFVPGINASIANFVRLWKNSNARIVETFLASTLGSI